MARPSIVDNFDSHCIPVTESGCWIWMAGCLKKMGYGRFRVGNKLWLAHRFNYERFVEKIPEGLLCLHRCDVPSCVNPAHLFLGTHADNRADMMAKGRQPKPGYPYKWEHPRGEKQWNHKLTEDDVRKIRLDTRRQAEIAKQFGVARETIRRIKSRFTWKHLT